MYPDKLDIPNDVYYILSDGFQLLEHCLALNEWLPGKFFISPRKRDVFPWLQKFNYSAEIKSKQDLTGLVNTKAILILPSGSHGYQELKGFNSFYLNHGISEKAYYKSGKRVDAKYGLRKERRALKDIPLQFARYLRGTYEYSLDYHKTFLELDDSKKTILYLPTQGVFSMLSDDVFHVLEDISNGGKYNVIIKLHALNWSLNSTMIPRIQGICPVDVNLHNVAPFLDLADLIIGDVSAATSAATYYHKKPIILLKKRGSVDLNKSCMAEDTCSVVYGDEIYSKLKQEVEYNLSNPGEKEAQRKSYFEAWYNHVDGTEGYKLAKRIVEIAESWK